MRIFSVVKIFTVLVVLAVSTQLASAQQYVNVKQADGTVVLMNSWDYNSSIAQAKSNSQASRSWSGHVGGSFGTGRYEGVGFSTSSPEAAVRRACYYGQRPMVGSAVTYGYNRRVRAWGYFATNLYR